MTTLAGWRYSRMRRADFPHSREAWDWQEFDIAGGEVGKQRVLAGPTITVTGVALRLAAEQIVSRLLLRRELRLVCAHRVELRGKRRHLRRGFIAGDRLRHLIEGGADPARDRSGQDEPEKARRRSAARAGRRPARRLQATRSPALPRRARTWRDRAAAKRDRPRRRYRAGPFPPGWLADLPPAPRLGCRAGGRSHACPRNCHPRDHPAPGCNAARARAVRRRAIAACDR